MEFSTLFVLNENLYYSLKTWISSKFNRQVLGIYFTHKILSHCKKFEEDKKNGSGNICLSIAGEEMHHIWFCDGKQFSPVVHPNRL